MNNILNILDGIVVADAEGKKQGVPVTQSEQKESVSYESEGETSLPSIVVDKPMNGSRHIIHVLAQHSEEITQIVEQIIFQVTYQSDGQSRYFIKNIGDIENTEVFNLKLEVEETNV